MQKFLIQILLLVALIVGALYLGFQGGGNINLGQKPTNATNRISHLKIDDATLNIEVADTDASRSRGLGGRDSLASDSGMLFVFPTASKYQFWMKDMRFPLDFIWISGDKIVDLLSNIQPPKADQADNTLNRYAPVADVSEVLEVNAGFISSHNIKVGDKVVVGP